MSPVTAITGLYIQGLLYGGPVALIWGWVLTSVFTMAVGLAFSELCSAMPQSGGLYFWSYMLGVKRGAFWSWVTGWINLLGQLAFVAGNEYTVVQVFVTMILLGTGTATGGGYLMSYGEQYLLLVCLLVSHAALNSFPMAVVARIAQVAAVWLLLGAAIVVGVLLTITEPKQSSMFVFTVYQNNPSSNITSVPYTFVLGLLTACWSQTGYDSAAHVIEETAQADAIAGRPIVMAIALASVTGLAYLLGLTYCIDVSHGVLLSCTFTSSAAKCCLLQIFWDSFAKRYGTGTRCIWLLGIPLGACWFCGLLSMTAASRMMYSFSRDGAMPFYRLIRYVDPGTQAPVVAVWAVAVAAILICTGLLKSLTIFLAITSVATAGLAAAYALPLWLRVLVKQTGLEAGPFNLGRWSTPIHATAALWLTFVTTIFMLPAAYPVTTVVGAPMAFALVVGPVLLCWCTWSRRWFGGPMPDVYNSEVGAGKSVAWTCHAADSTLFGWLQIVKLKSWILDPPRTMS
eukprot:jgi/Astpho2/3306/e_gw1.00054.39.1_t